MFNELKIITKMLTVSKGSNKKGATGLFVGATVEAVVTSSVKLVAEELVVREPSTNTEVVADSVLVVGFASVEFEVGISEVVNVKGTASVAYVEFGVDVTGVPPYTEVVADPVLAV